ncbi:MAG: hypothetical protein WAT43_02125 [Chitinophagales bacterium]
MLIFWRMGGGCPLGDADFLDGFTQSSRRAKGARGIVFGGCVIGMVCFWMVCFWMVCFWMVCFWMVCVFSQRTRRAKGAEGIVFGGCVIGMVCFFAKLAKGKGREGDCFWKMFACEGVFLDGLCFFAKGAKGIVFGGCVFGMVCFWMVCVFSQSSRRELFCRMFACEGVFLDGVCFFAKNAKGKGREGLGEGCVWWMFRLVLVEIFD